MSLLVGIDGGGSHTEAVAGHSPDRILARWRGGAGAVRPGAEVAAVERWREAVQQMLSELPGAVVTRVVVGAAGTGREATRLEVERRFAESLEGAVRVRVTTDGVIAMEAAFPGGRAGIVLMAGSGSIAYGRDVHGGVLRRAGGLGWRMGDEGGGYWLAREALAAIGRALDGRGDASVLVDRLSDAVGATAPEDLVRWSVAADTGTIAALAPIVAAAAIEGDGVAAGLVQRAAHALAALVTALLPGSDTTTGTDVALGGGLLTGGSAVREALVQTLQEREPSVRLRDEPVEPPVGALALASRL